MQKKPKSLDDFEEETEEIVDKEEFFRAMDDNLHLARPSLKQAKSSTVVVGPMSVPNKYSVKKEDIFKEDEDYSESSEEGDLVRESPSPKQIEETEKDKEILKEDSYSAGYGSEEEKPQEKINPQELNEDDGSTKETKR
jgi:hypothetical protein